MSVFFTSDSHYGHENIIRLAGRPFKDVNHMNEEMVRRWNEVVGDEDTVYHLGDVALGTFADSIKYVGRLNGIKILVPGNHDRVSSVESEKRRERFLPDYEAVFDQVIGEIAYVSVKGHLAMVSHYPYEGDSQENDRHVALRPKDNGLPLIHGHIHKATTAHGNMFHVGVDAHSYYPVHEDVIAEWLQSL